jgi:hypothetical protein
MSTHSQHITPNPKRQQQQGLSPSTARYNHIKKMENNNSILRYCIHYVQNMQRSEQVSHQYDYGLYFQGSISGRCRTFLLTTPSQHTGPTPVSIEDSLPPVNQLRCERMAHLHTRSYTTIPPTTTKTDPRLIRGKEHHFLTYHAVVHHGLTNASILIFVQQWNSRDCSPGIVDSDTANDNFPAFSKFTVTNISLTNDMNAHSCNKFVHRMTMRSTQPSACSKTFYTNLFLEKP